ncbi:hypothetical protein [Sphingopyxis witflariensis]|nr:hypothetical protein [Sphingopyxis witflariensis]
MSTAHLSSFSLRPSLTVIGAGSLALMTMERALDPVLLWFAPLAIPAAIWLQARREWVTAMRNIGALIAQQKPGPDRPVCPPRPRRAKRPLAAAQTSRRTLIVHYRKEMG